MARALYDDPLLKFQGISVLPEYALLPQFVVLRHYVMIGCDRLYVHIGCKTVLHMQNTQVKLDEPSMYSLGTLETERSNVNDIVDMNNIAMSTIEDYSI